MYIYKCQISSLLKCYTVLGNLVFLLSSITSTLLLLKDEASDSLHEPRPHFLSWSRRETHRSVTYTMRSSRFTTRNASSTTNPSRLERWVPSSRTGSLTAPDRVICLSLFHRFLSQVELEVPKGTKPIPRACSDYPTLPTAALLPVSDRQQIKSQPMKVGWFCYGSATSVFILGF